MFILRTIRNKFTNTKWTTEILVVDYLTTAVYLVLTQSVFLLIRIDRIYITRGNIQRKN
jgi:hypothetical protein